MMPATDPREPTPPAPVDPARRRSRSIAIAWTLVAMVVLFYVLTIVKLGPNVFSRPF